ncbi:Phytanoyl-CoA dioxygenase [Niveomyces insectorum RCEF 264]|uniref:Phytanoyl-CoA dioxygenase n=1 Tax=Niveomyces insectorum RCEF 264 TaxID=1081102 RepID=A0A167QFM4_9HYPO|nr:Phytanoyl-CoA dioxygenase [Niveomyces insectorum RCEF 264]
MTQDILEKPIYVNDGPLRPSEYAFLQPSDPSLPLDELRRRLETEGYLFLKGLLPRNDVLTCRAKYFEHLAPSGVLKPGTEPVLGVFDASKDLNEYPSIGVGRLESLPPQSRTFLDKALDAHTQPWYAQDLCRHPVLLDFMARFTGWGDHTQPLVRTLLRNNIPGAKAIGVHYDQIFLRYGEPTSITVWVPLGDIDIRGGGLVYLEKGHELGKQVEEEFTIKAKASGLTDAEAKSAFNQNMLSSGVLTDNTGEFGRKHNRRWLVTGYEAGDVVLHTTYAIHASTINHDDNNVIRLATDLRFVDSSKPWDERWSFPFRLGDGL